MATFDYSGTKDQIPGLLLALQEDVDLINRGTTGAIYDAGAAAMNGVVAVVGLGERLFSDHYAGGRWPNHLAAMPFTERDELAPHQVGGAIILLVAASTPEASLATLRRLQNGHQSLLARRWLQSGYLPTPDPLVGVSRNVLGSLDGLANPKPGRTAWERCLWVTEEDDEVPWMLGGTYLVARKIEVDLDAWDALPLAEQEALVGRRQADGVVTGAGRPSHVEVARSAMFGPLPMLRRSFSYSDGGAQGLLFAAYSRNPSVQVSPVLTELSQRDPLNAFVRHVGSVVFAIPRRLPS
jgi:Dyp-type peroxidase family